ncbi:MAG: hypothetical protein G8345_19245 [Magnetococcales bacterium]|nr:hypothetical protein [Magnetococcales bacterium]NGZ29012.1 hypothetical protein [Magnetococcales bacterium]
MQISKICKQIELEMRKADYYIRFYDYHVEQTLVSVDSLKENSNWNPYEGNFTPRIIDYLFWEVDVSQNYFSPHQRFQLTLRKGLLTTVNTKNITPLYHDQGESREELAFSLVVKLRQHFDRYRAWP